MSISRLASWASGIVTYINPRRDEQVTTTKIGPKEQRLREMREAMIKRTEQNRRLIRGKTKVKAIGQVVNIRASKRAKNSSA
jgi:hypothetical protein